MNIDREQPVKTTIKLTVELLEQELQPYVQQAAKKINQSAKVPGFRPGHVPYEMLKQQIGEMSIFQEAAQIAVTDTLPNAVRQEKIDFVGQPQISIEQLAPGNAFKYTATFALMPAVDVRKYTNVKVKKDKVEFDEKKYTKTLEELQRMQAKTNPVERTAKKGDRVEVNFSITQAGVPMEGGQGSKVPVQLGEGSFIPGFEEHIEGMKAGDNKKFKLTFPKEYGAKHLAGKECDFDVTLNVVNEVVLPELNDEFAKNLNFKSKQELEEKIKENITHELTDKIERDFELAMIEAMLKQAEFDPIPDLMINSELDRMLQELQSEIEQQGAKFPEYLEHIKKSEQELRDSWKDKAEQRVKSALFLKAVGEKEAVPVDDKEIEDSILKYRETYKDMPDILQQLDSEDFKSYTRTVLRNEKVIKKLKEYAEKK